MGKPTHGGQRHRYGLLCFCHFSPPGGGWGRYSPYTVASSVFYHNVPSGVAHPLEWMALGRRLPADYFASTCQPFGEPWCRQLFSVTLFTRSTGYLIRRLLRGRAMPVTCRILNDPSIRCSRTWGVSCYALIMAPPLLDGTPPCRRTTQLNK